MPLRKVVLRGWEAGKSVKEGGVVGHTLRRSRYEYGKQPTRRGHTAQALYDCLPIIQASAPYGADAYRAAALNAPRDAASVTANMLRALRSNRDA